MNPELQQTFVVLSVVFGTGVIIAVSIAWFQHQTRVRALDVLRVYAERGEEPPETILRALTGLGSYAPPKSAAPWTRGRHLAHLAANTVFVLGAVGIVWWKAPDPANPGGLVVFAILAGLFFTAAAAAQLVYALHARE